METSTINRNLYCEKSVAANDYLLSERAIHTLFNMGKREEFGYLLNEFIELETTISVDTKKFEEAVGNLTEEDLENIWFFLNENSSIKEMMKKRLEEIKPKEIMEFDMDLFVSVNQKEIVIQATAG